MKITVFQLLSRAAPPFVTVPPRSSPAPSGSGRRSGCTSLPLPHSITPTPTTMLTILPIPTLPLFSSYAGGPQPPTMTLPPPMSLLGGSSITPMYVSLYPCARNFISDEGFRNALSLIDIGQNDLADSFAKNLSYAQVIKKIPSFITEIENAVKVGRRGWVRRLTEERGSFSRARRNGKEGEIDVAADNGPGWRLVSPTTPLTERLVRWRLCSAGEDERHKQRGRE
ncbi:hypothetical protein LR48_Vigan118s002900 [Vigna angularis]|uniref:Uncharacterized protein n=1 Tax=Phaseolus angularis TaxID=3914 RepID=A0A0L9T645_PHAAN|nr:hypothetical protein LR48_Vigan118s002900 [Vigna angularis]